MQWAQCNSVHLPHSLRNEVFTTVPGRLLKTTPENIIDRQDHKHMDHQTNQLKVLNQGSNAHAQIILLQIYCGKN